MRPFALDRAPLLRACVARVKPAEAVLLVDLHHAALDGASEAIFWRDLERAYDGLALGPAPLQYRDYSEWRTSAPVQALVQGQGDYWLAQLGDAPAPLSLPLDFERPPARRLAGGVHRFALTETVVEKARAACARYVTLSSPP